MIEYVPQAVIALGAVGVMVLIVRHWRYEAPVLVETQDIAELLAPEPVVISGLIGANHVATGHGRRRATTGPRRQAIRA